MKMDEMDTVDTNGRKWMKMEDTGWEMAESGRKWTKWIKWIQMDESR